MTPSRLLGTWLGRRVAPEAADWLAESMARVKGATGERDLYMRIGQVARRLGTADLAPDDTEFGDAQRARAGWDPRHWTVDQAARIHLLLESTDDPDVLARRLTQLCVTADVAELVAFYQGLPLYPDGPRHAARCAEGIRSNMRNVFEAVAHRNPYPSEHLAEGAWNQMVLKALFVGSELAPIVGLDARRNETLAVMLIDYAHERWAASRAISPELWRCVGPYAQGARLDDLRRLLERGNAGERAAAVLALAESPDPAAHSLREREPELVAAARSGRLAWNNVPQVS
jgi:hypothetical protein